MANIKKLNLIEKEFVQICNNFSLKEYGGLDIKIDGMSHIADDLNIDILSHNGNLFLENIIRQNFTDTKKIIVEGDSTIEVKGSGFLIVYVSLNSNIVLKLDDQNFSAPIIYFVVASNIEMKLLEFSNGGNLWKITKIFAGKDSKVIHGQIILNSKINISSSFLEERANYDLNLAFFSNYLKTYIKNVSNNLEMNSSSNMNIGGAVKMDAEVIIDGLVNISQAGNNCSGHQKITGVVLDDKSIISAEPVLEVYNNNVSCSHGASISQIKEETKFYFLSRGIAVEDAERLIVSGFVDKVLNALTYENFNTSLDEKWVLNNIY